MFSMVELEAAKVRNYSMKILAEKRLGAKRSEGFIYFDLYH